MALPKHLFVSDSDGALYDTRNADWWTARPLRPNYRRTFGGIKTAAGFKATLRNGAFAWPGGYPLYFITSDGAALCFTCGKTELRYILPAIRGKQDDGWRVVRTDINYEDSSLYCAHCSRKIEPAYGEEEASQ